MIDTIEDKIEKLLRVADGTANENESAVALRMAQKLADAHNLDLGQIGKSGARKDEQISKGLYTYQRSLYAKLGEMNHCRVWVTKGLTRGSKYQTRLLGSKVNVAVTKRMADYLEEVANRMVRERFEKGSYFSKDAHIFREGMIDRMIERVAAQRVEEERERQRQKREQDARMRHPGAASENAVVLISDVTDAEAKANHDYLNGEGSWDRMRAERLAYAEKVRRAAEEYEAWQLANPEEAAAKAAEARAEREKWNKKWEAQARASERAAERRREERIKRHGYDPKDYETPKPTKYDSHAYRMGRVVGGEVNLDDQIDEEKREKLA